MVDQFAPLGRTPWARALNQANIDSLPGKLHPPSAIDPNQIAVAMVVDPAYQAYSVVSNPRAAAQASQDRWGAVGRGSFGKLGADYANDPGTALTQDIQTLRNSHGIVGRIAMDTATWGIVSNPYVTAAAGNFVGGAVHTAVDETKRYGPVAVSAFSRYTGLPLDKVLGIKDPLANARTDYRRDPAGAAAEDIFTLAGAAGGVAGLAGRAGAAAEAGGGAAARAGAESAVAPLARDGTTPPAPTGPELPRADPPSTPTGRGSNLAADGPAPANSGPGRLLNREPNTNSGLATRRPAGKDAPGVPARRPDNVTPGPAGAAPPGRPGTVIGKSPDTPQPATVGASPQAPDAAVNGSRPPAAVANQAGGGANGGDAAKPEPADPHTPDGPPANKPVPNTGNGGIQDEAAIPSSGGRQMPSAQSGTGELAGDEYLPGLPANAPKPLGRGSTGRNEPANLNEQSAMTAVRSNPGGRTIDVPMSDPRWPGSDGWVKMQQVESGVVIHYVRDTRTGAVDDFKFK